MTDADRALAPLDAARAAIDQLDSYATPQELAGALEAIGQAIERSLRQLLRLDSSQPDDVRLRALDPDALPFDRVLALLRQRERISLALANEVHAVRHAAERGRRGEVRAADADQAAAAVDRLRQEVSEGRSAETRRIEHPTAAESDAAVSAAAHAAVERGEFEERAHQVPLRSRLAPLRIALVAGAVALFLAGYFLVSRVMRPSRIEQGVEAFQAGRLGVAERHFRAALQEGEDATAELYLGRVLRREGRHAEAGAVLNAARKRYPQDADILRELGHLLAIDLKRPEAALEPYRRAVELAPEEAANWVALVRALRAAGEPTAERWFARAPAAAQAILRSGR